ncbi:hypothetical protein PLESTF_001146300 [Pleodorina starrii]|nr:hypothetical protein PLESTF_001146300 [Pleodorina starrii]
MVPASAMGAQGALCSGHMGSPYASHLNPMAMLSRRRAPSATALRCIRSQRAVPCCATPATTGLMIELQPGFDRPQSRPEEAQAGSTPVVEDPPAAAQEAAAGPAAVQAPATATPPSSSASSPTQTPEDRKKLWFAAIKPPMYSVGFIPVLVAAANVFLEFGVLPWARVGGFVLAAILVIGWLNLSNDAFDAQTGVDATKPESVVNLLGGGPSRRAAVLLLAKSLLVAGVALLANLIASAPAGDPRPAGLLAFSIACGYVYQGPPFRLSYKGLGEPLCFFAFGPSATTAFYLALRPDGGAAAALTAGVPPAVWACSLLVGLTTTVILFCSHFHQIAGDTAAGKRSPLVRLGTELGRKVLRAAAIATQAAALGAAAAGALPWAAAAAVTLAAPAARTMVAFADDNHTVPERVAPLKRFAVKWHILFGLCLCLGLAAARLLAGTP